MRLLTFVDPPSGTLHVGALTRDARRVVDLTVVGLDDMFMALERADGLARIAGHLVEGEGAVGYPTGEVHIVAPMPAARAAHLVAPAPGGRALAVAADGPPMAFADPAPLLGPGDPVPARHPWALAVGAVIGTGGRDIPEEFALAHVAGYAVAGRPLAGGEAPPVVQLGPWLVTPEHAGEPGSAHAARLLVDGAPVATGAWATGVPFAAMIAHASRRFELRAGDLFTAVLDGPDGRPCAAPVAPGQAVRLEVDGLGALVATAQ